MRCNPPPTSRTRHVAHATELPERCRFVRTRCNSLPWGKRLVDFCRARVLPRFFGWCALGSTTPPRPVPPGISCALESGRQFEPTTVLRRQRSSKYAVPGSGRSAWRVSLHALVKRVLVGNAQLHAARLVSFMPKHACSPIEQLDKCAVT